MASKEKEGTCRGLGGGGAVDEPSPPWIISKKATSRSKSAIAPLPPPNSKFLEKELVASSLTIFDPIEDLGHLFCRSSDSLDHRSFTTMQHEEETEMIIYIFH
jgi:hypothetical protein